jgi:hypothetical protein
MVYFNLQKRIDVYYRPNASTSFPAYTRQRFPRFNIFIWRSVEGGGVQLSFTWSGSFSVKLSGISPYEIPISILQKASMADTKEMHAVYWDIQKLVQLLSR